jgi:hypothetical protein
MQQMQIKHFLMNREPDPKDMLVEELRRAALAGLAWEARTEAEQPQALLPKADAEALTAFAQRVAAREFIDDRMPAEARRLVGMLGRAIDRLPDDGDGRTQHHGVLLHDHKEALAAFAALLEAALSLRWAIMVAADLR